ncbi:MAG TPA: hypothetical protein VF316_16335 [Polyangiaceae bacterium]
MRTALVLVALSLVGCPAKTERSAASDAAVPSCARVGQTCEFSPGKLGSCVERDECASPPCLVCQSQH